MTKDQLRKYVGDLGDVTGSVRMFWCSEPISHIHFNTSTINIPVWNAPGVFGGHKRVKMSSHHDWNSIEVFKRVSE